MSEHFIAPVASRQERLIHGALSALERATNFSEMTALKKKIASLALATTTLAPIPLGMSIDNIMENHAEATANSAHIDIRRSANSTSGSDTALVFMDGFNSFNSNILADSIGSSLQTVNDGEVWSVNYNNAHLDYAAMADMLAENAQVRGLSDLQLFGYSAGGDIALRVAEELQARDIYVSAIYLNSTPDGIEGLRPERQHEVQTYASAMANVPWLSYYDPARYVGEMAIRSENLKTTEGFADAHRGVTELIQADYTPGTWLLIDQLVAIEQANAKVRLARLAEHAKPNEKPVIIYLGTGEGGYDDFVDDKKSSEAICGYASEVGLSCLRYDIPGAIHMRPDATKEAYAEILAQASPEIRAAIRGDEQHKA